MTEQPPVVDLSGLPYLPHQMKALFRLKSRRQAPRPAVSLIMRYPGEPAGVFGVVTLEETD